MVMPHPPHALDSVTTLRPLIVGVAHGGQPHAAVVFHAAVDLIAEQNNVVLLRQGDELLLQVGTHQGPGRIVGFIEHHVFGVVSNGILDLLQVNLPVVAGLAGNLGDAITGS